MGRKMSLLLTIVMMIITISGCGQNTAVGKGGIKIFFSLNEMDTFRQTLVDSAAEQAALMGAQFAMEDAQGSIEKQVEQLKAAAAENYDVIICSPVSVDTAVQLKMSAGDIPIVFVNSCPDEKHLQAGKYIYVGSSEQVAGEFQAEYVLSKLSGRQEINVVLIKGPASHSATEGRTTGVKRTLEKSGKQIHYVFEDSAGWDTGQAQKLFELFLSTGVSADCVICNNDSMALGVMAACKNNGIDCSTLPILGVDATADGCEAISNGDMAFTVYQSGSGQGHAAVDAAIQLVGSGSVKDVEGSAEDGRYVWVDFERVDSSNVSNYGR
ncbi:MAG: sugar ABC transporter substrate-binding protein [Lachnospiraceae bacterium]|nr:sugar ABC transporter substrate-binding protein [Lachnospiraceae bacterium]